MNILKSIRSLFGFNTEVSQAPIDQLDTVLLQKYEVEEKMQKANSEFDQLDNEFSLKIAACDVLIEKGVKEGSDNKRFLVDRLDRITNSHLELIKGLIDESKEINEQQVQIESNIITKAIEITSHLDDEDQLLVKAQLQDWKETGIVKGQDVRNQAKAITLVLEEFVKGGEGSKGGKIIGHTKSGKPIYENKGGKDYKDFSKKDHYDAMFEHAKRAKLPDSESYDSSKESKYENHSDKSESHRKNISLEEAKRFSNEDNLSNKEIKKSHEPIAIELAGKGDIKQSTPVEGHYSNMIIRKTFKEGEREVSKILFLRRAADKKIAPNQFCLPGGHIDEGETIEQAGIRELKEEANLDATFAYVKGKAKCDDGKWAFYLEGFAQGDPMLLDGESINAAWMSAEEWVEADLIFDLKEHLLAMESVGTTDASKVFDILKKGEDEGELEKASKGAGSRGGKIIGYTKSLKPIYSKKKGSDEAYRSFSDKDHAQAATIHREAGEYEEAYSHGVMEEKHKFLNDYYDRKGMDSKEQKKWSEKAKKLGIDLEKSESFEELIKGGFHPEKPNHKYVRREKSGDGYIYYYDSPDKKSKDGKEYREGLYSSNVAPKLDQAQIEKIARNINAMDVNYEYIDGNRNAYNFWRELSSKLQDHIKALNAEDLESVGKLVKPDKAKFFKMIGGGEIEKGEGEEVEMPWSKFIKEHDRLLDVLENGSEEERKKEAKRQREEVSEYKREGKGEEGEDELEKSFDIDNPFYYENEEELIKGKAAVDGEERTWGGKKYKKSGGKWSLVGGGKKSKVDHIGNTTSGHKVYNATADHDVYQKHTPEEHMAIAEFHEKKMEGATGSTERASQHLEMAHSHRKEAQLKEEKKKKLHSTKQLKEHVENTSTDALKKVAENKDHPHNDAAKRELERRRGEKKDGGDDKLGKNWYDKNQLKIVSAVEKYLSENFSTKEAAEELGYDEEDMEDVDSSIFEDLAEEWAGDYKSLVKHHDELSEVIDELHGGGKEKDNKLSEAKKHIEEKGLNLNIENWDHLPTEITSILPQDSVKKINSSLSKLSTKWESASDRGKDVHESYYDKVNELQEQIISEFKKVGLDLDSEEGDDTNLEFKLKEKK